MVIDFIQMLDAYGFYLIVVTAAVVLRLYALVWIWTSPGARRVSQQQSKRGHSSYYR